MLIEEEIPGFAVKTSYSLQRASKKVVRLRVETITQLLETKRQKPLE
jgi:hypothetical protein